MMARLVSQVVLALAVWAGAAPLGLALAQSKGAAAPIKLLLLSPADDPRFERSRLERATLGHATRPALASLQVALQEGKFELEAASARIELAHVEVADAAAAKAAVLTAEKSGTAAVFTDLPAAWVLAVADAAPKLPMVNLSERSDRLRQADCRANLWHVPPSDRMHADALAQTLVARKWPQVLLLVGSHPDDAARAAAAQAAIQRWGLKVVASRSFVLGADPRQRDSANPLLLTGGANTPAYDVVWVVDSDGEFAASLPYRTALPRPVVGDAGLVPLTWSARFERYGAPQVSRRLLRAVPAVSTTGVSPLDWAAWMGGKAAVAAAVLSATKPTGFAAALASVNVDGSKGVPLSFRAWDGQLRQPLLLGDGQSVIGLAPVDGVLHPKNNLDTLGADAPEKLCKARP
jgi:ABC transporter substrate binding protein (PQQ-dependent alcohol dehydrogenase system)